MTRNYMHSAGPDDSFNAEPLAPPDSAAHVPQSIVVAHQRNTRRCFADVVSVRYALDHGPTFPRRTLLLLTIPLAPQTPAARSSSARSTPPAGFAQSIVL
jgi:hypothetical protein